MDGHVAKNILIFYLVLGCLGRDTECPLLVCLLSRSSASTHFLSRTVVEKQLYYFQRTPYGN